MLHGIGAQVLQKGQSVFGFTGLAFDKRNAGETTGSTEHEQFRQVSLDGYYGLTDEVMLRTSIPYVHKRISSDGETNTASGLGDASVGLTYQVEPHANDKILVAFTGDLKLPTGQNSKKDSQGDIEEQHLQLGSGSTDVQLGVDLTTEAGEKGLLFGGVSYRRNGSNRRHYHYGDAVFYHLGYSHSISGSTVGVAELDGRISGKDRQEDGLLDNESGGHLTYLAVSVRQRLSKDLAGILSVQQPIFSNLHGSQHEGAVFSISVAKQF